MTSGHLRFRVSRGMLVRMLADAAMTNIALAGALALRLVMHLAFAEGGGAADFSGEFWGYVRAYLWNAPLLTGICLLVYSLSGFYTYGRSYQGKYKSLIIVQAVGYSYLLFACLTYFSWDRFGWIELPRGALLLTFALSLAMCLASRTWTFLWEVVVRPERESKRRLRSEGGKNVLVIGGAGYIGSALIPKLLNHGYRVRVLDMFIYGTEPLAPIIRHPRLELVEGDFRHVHKVVSAMKEMDAVIHLGAIVGDPACDIDEKVTLDINLSATEMIANVAKASGIRRFIFASTCSVYGACDDLLDEHSEVKPISLYGHTKLAAERGLQQMADDAFRPTILRFATIYGLSGRTRFDLVVNLLAAKAKTEGVITVNGGDQWRPFVHVDDAALGVLQALQSPLSLVGNQVFNVGSNAQNYTIAQIGQLVKERVIGAELILDANSKDKRNYRVSFNKIERVLDYAPAWTVEEGIDQVLEAIAGGEVVDYRDSRYSNVKYLLQNGAIDVIRVDDDWSRHLHASQKSSAEMDAVVAT